MAKRYSIKFLKSILVKVSEALEKQHYNQFMELYTKNQNVNKFNHTLLKEI
jgi:hypothetical protein